MDLRNNRLFFCASLIVVVFFLPFAVVSPVFGARIYVDVSALGANDGSSWADSFDDLQAALSAVVSGDEIWVAAGTYTPTDATDRSATFVVQNGVRLYGGFAGTETSLGERDWTTYVTVLSGEIGTPNLEDNSYRVVYSQSTGPTTEIDGFTVTRGYADREGAGIWLEQASPVLSNLTITDNHAIGPPGWVGLYSTNLSNPTLDHVTISDNGGGGGNVWGGTVTACTVTGNDNWGFGFIGTGTIEDSEFSSNALYGLTTRYASVRNCRFSGNGDGGVSISQGDPYFESCYFVDNTTTYFGGGLAVHGAATVVNCVFIGNSAFRGGALYLSNDTSVILTNVSFFGNETTVPDGGAVRIVDPSSSADFYNVVIWGNDEPQVSVLPGTTMFSSSLVAGSGGSAAWDPAFGTDGGGNIDADPLFIEADGGDLHLMLDSPAIDVGDNAAPNLPPTDPDGQPRITGGTVDMGAYEFVCPSGPRIYVDAAAASGIITGESWSNAFPTLRHALAVACGSVAEVWVAAGTYIPTGGGDRSRSFELQNGLAIYGGFAGWETSLLQRDYGANVTTLSGEIGSPNPEDNSIHVVVGSGTDASAVLDGVTVTRGYADNDFGGGMYNLLGSPTIRNTIFTANSATSGGGAVANLVGSGEFTNVAFYGNEAFVGPGGGIYNSSASPVMTNVTMADNTSISGGGAMYNLGGNAVVTNAIMWGNTGTTISNAGGNPLISYSLIEGSGGSGSWNPAMGTDGGNNVDADPLFIDASNGDLRIGSNSPAIDTGDNNAPNLLATDAAGNPRIIGPTVDMGAYESLVATAIDNDLSWPPAEAALKLAFPNPFNPVVRIPFDLDHARDVHIRVYDVQGKLVRTLVNGPRAPGHDEVKWDARDNAGRPVASGVYIVRMQAESFRAQRKVVFLK